MYYTCTYIYIPSVQMPLSVSTWQFSISLSSVSASAGPIVWQSVVDILKHTYLNITLYVCTYFVGHCLATKVFIGLYNYCRLWDGCG